MYDKSSKISVGSTHGKLIMVGEHSVVYGQPAIALPFPVIEATSTVKDMSVTGQSTAIIIDCMYFVGPLEDAPRKMLGITACIKETLKELEENAEGLHIQLTSTIPVGRGLGSSAAVAIAIVKSLFSYFEQELTQDKLMELVHIAERHAHGNPSGIDMAAASSNLPIWFQKEEDPGVLEIGKPFHLVVADTGRVGDTRLAVESIRDKYQSNPIATQQAIELLGKFTYMAKDALLNGEMVLLGKALNSAQDELIKLGVSDSGIDSLVQVARDAGALGAKLTGGGRGGCIIALAKDASHASALAQVLRTAGANETWKYQVGEN